MILHQITQSFKWVHPINFPVTFLVIISVPPRKHFCQINVLKMELVNIRR